MNPFQGEVTMLRRAVLYTCISAVALTACSKKQPEPPSPTVTDTPSNIDQAAEDAARRAREQARQDSIARARDAEAEAERQRQMRLVRESMEEMVYFAYDAADLSEEAQTTLGRKVQILRANPDLRIRITGHTDERGSVEYNLALGMRRAQSVKDYLSNFGIEESRLEIVSMGEDQPQEMGSDESAWSRNRRAAFTITGGSVVAVPGQ